MARWWVHGDVRADGKSFYDRRKDSFCALPTVGISAIDALKYRDELRHFTKDLKGRVGQHLDSSKPPTWDRPDDAPNIFAELPEVKMHGMKLKKLEREARAVSALENPQRTVVE